VTQEPRDDEAVRRLLGAAATPHPALPDEVRARLDGVLADLVAERAADETARRPAEQGPAEAGVPAVLGQRRRRWPQVLVAAAAVAVVGVGLGTLGGLQGQDAELSTGADAPAGGQGYSSGDSAGESSDDSSGDSSGGAGSDAVEEGSPLEGPNLLRDGEGPTTQASPVAPRLRSDSLPADVRRARDLAFDTRTARDQSEPCVRPRPASRPGDDVLAVRLDGRPAVLVLRAPDGGERRAQVYLCAGAGRPAATTTVAAR
jgi:hypothetical protein